jgi:predicted dehydrogenase
MVMKTSIALVGVGGYGTYYLQELLQAKYAEKIQLVAGIDPYPERSPMLSNLQEARIPIYPDLEGFYKHNVADLVILAVPIHLHAPLSCLAAAQGSSVLCEKPLGASLADAQNMRAAEKRFGRQIAIGYQWSFSDPGLSLKRDILSGRLGRPLHFKTMLLWPRTQSYYQRNAWAGRLRAEDGAWVLDSPVNNATAHYLHNMLFLLGSSLEKSVHISGLEAELYRANPIENYDAAALRIHTHSGPDLLFYTAHSVIEHQGPVIHYEFENAVVEYSDADPEFRVRFSNGQTESYGNPETTAYNKVWQSLEAVHTGNPVVCGIRTALPHLLCVLGAQKAPIMDFEPERIHVLEQDQDRTIWADGLAESFKACYQAGCLPSDLKMNPWKNPATQVSFTEFDQALNGMD